MSEKFSRNKRNTPRLLRDLFWSKTLTNRRLTRLSLSRTPPTRTNPLLHRVGRFPRFPSYICRIYRICRICHRSILSSRHEIPNRRRIRHISTCPAFKGIFPRRMSRMLKCRIPRKRHRLPKQRKSIPSIRRFLNRRFRLDKMDLCLDDKNPYREYKRIRRRYRIKNLVLIR